MKEGNRRTKSTKGGMPSIDYQRPASMLLAAHNTSGTQDERFLSSPCKKMHLPYLFRIALCHSRTHGVAFYVASDKAIGKLLPCSLIRPRDDGRRDKSRI